MFYLITLPDHLIYSSALKNWHHKTSEKFACSRRFTTLRSLTPRFTRQFFKSFEYTFVNPNKNKLVQK